MNLSTLDVSIVVVYVLLIMIMGIWLGRKENADDYFVNGRKTKTWMLVLTLLSTSVGAGTLLGVIAETTQTGISYALSFFALTIVGWPLMGWIAPYIKKWGDEHQAYTFGDFLFKRFSSRTRRVGSVVVLTGYIAFTSMQLVASGLLVSAMSGLSFQVSLIIGTAITLIYTTFSGIKGDFYTDVIQFFVILPVFGFLIWKGLGVMPLSEIVANTPKEFFDPYNYAGPGFFFASVFFGFMLLVSAMEVWQRIFSATNEASARNAMYLGVILKVGFIFASTLIGLIAYQLVTGVEGDGITFNLMAQLLPQGLLGIGFASILAVLMSTIDSSIVVGSATITRDFWGARNPNMSDKETLRVGRYASFIFGIVAFLVASFAQDLVQLAVGAAQILAVLVPSLLGGLFWKRVNEKTAFWSILFGYVITLVAIPFIPNYAFVPGLVACFLFFGFFILRSPKVV